MNENISQFLSKYLSNPDPRYAVMLKGKWGCGKSFFIQKWIEKYKSELDNGGAVLEPIYVSLYGLTNTSQITTVIDRVLHPYLYSKGAETLKKVMKVAGKLMLNTSIDFNKDGKDDISMAATLDSLALLGSKEKNAEIGTKFIVFDDLERSLIDMKLLLGYINNFVEHGACHVIIIGDETHLTVDAKSRLVEFKEKTVGREFEIIPDVDAAVDSFINNDIVPKIEWLAKQKDFILDCFTATQCDNLRLLRQCLYDFSVLYAEVHIENDKKTDPILMSLLGDYIITYCEYRGEFCQLIRDYNWDYFSGIFGDEETKNKVSKFQSKYSSIIERYKVDVLDYDCIKQIIREIETGCSIKYYVEGLLRQRQGNMSVQDKLADFVHLSNEEFEKEYKKLEEDLINNRVVAPYLMGRSMALLFYFDYKKMYTISCDLVSAVKEHIANFYHSISNKDILYRDNIAFCRGLGSYGGYNESQIQKDFLLFTKELFEKREGEVKNEIEEILLNLDNINVEKLKDFCNKSVPGQHRSYNDISIFKNVDAKILTANVLNLNNNALISFSDFLSLHYVFCSKLHEGCDYYKDDIVTLQQMYEMLKDELSVRTCVDKYILEYFLKHLDGAIQRAKGNNNQINVDS